MEQCLHMPLSDSGGWALAQEWAEVLGQPVDPEQPDSPRCCFGLPWEQ